MMKRRTTLLFLPLLLAACSENPEDGTVPAASPFEVSIGSGARLDIRARSATRTSLDEGGEEVRWQEGDRLTLWARNSASETVLDGAAFTLYHYNATYNSASFRGSIRPMPEDTYTYYAVSPVPASTDGLRAGYDIPAVQDGAFHGEWDVMVATPIEGAGPLREHDKKDANGISDNTDVVDLQFAHKIHVLKIAIPRNDLGEPVSEITLTFPSPVAGRLTVDASDPAADGVLAGSGNTLTLRFSEPKDAGAVVYAMIAPLTLGEGETVSIVAAGATSESEPRTFVPATADRRFAAGHTTPINYNIPAAAQELTRVTFRLAETGINTLGEAIDTFTVTAPEGWTFEDNTRSRTFDVTGTGDHTVRFRSYTNPTEEMAGFQVTYDSEHALLTEEFTLPAVTVGGETVVEFRVPYLFEETFGGITDFSHDDNLGTGATNSGNNTAVDLSGYGLSGWTGARCGASAGKAIRICSRNECAALTRGSYHGRTDTPTLSALKGSCKVIVRFNYSINRNSNQGNVLQPYFAAGITDASDRNATSNLWGSFISGEGNPGTILQYNIPAVVYDLNDSGALNGSFDNIPLQGEFSTTASASQRLVWEVYMKSGEPRAFATYYYSNNWVYLDNIRVSIAQ